MSAPIPDWLMPVVKVARTVRAEQLSQFIPPDDHDGREGAVLILFGEGDLGPDLLLIERAHDMRSHAGQPAFPGGARGRPARGERGDRPRSQRH
jgi:hypothetical protein